MIRKLFAATALCLACAGGAQAKPDPNRTAIAQAEAALAAGNFATARILALAELSKSRNDPRALTVLAAVGIAMGEPAAARTVAERSYRLAADDDGRHLAARLAARAAHDEGRIELAKLWLRRAYQTAPTTEARHGTVASFRALRDSRRLRYGIELSLSPSDNVNQGARDRVLTVDGHPTYFIFDGATMALPGWEAALSFDIGYGLHRSKQRETELVARLRHRAYALTDRAERIAPEAKGSDFATTDVDLGFLRRNFLTDRHSLHTGIVATKSWLAGSPYSLRLRAQADLTTLIDPRTRSRLGFAVERQWRDADAAFATAAVLTGGMERALSGGDRVGLRLDLGKTFSDDENQRNTRLGAELRYARARPVAGAYLSASLGVATRDYPVFFGGVFGDNGRHDLALSSTIDVALPALGGFGFEPVVSLYGSRTRSNISRYDTRALGIGITLRSQF